MRIVSWNVNSVRKRLPRLLALLGRHEPDVVCLQETKVAEDGFPSEVSAAGYRVLVHGQESYNGVAILIRDSRVSSTRLPFDPTQTDHCGTTASKRFLESKEHRRGFPGDTLPEQARVISACVNGVRIINAYVVNGVATNSEQFRIKQSWMDSFGSWLRRLPETPPLLVVGDFNVAPDDRDVWDPVGLQRRIHCTSEEREWLRLLKGDRLKDLLRVVTEESGVFTWWPYQRDALSRNEGLRFDLALGDIEVANIVERVWVDREERQPDGGPGRPSDHAPVIVELREERDGTS